MYYKLKYRDAVNGKCEGENSYETDIKEFSGLVVDALNHHALLDLSIMPGDRTHYNLRVRWHNKKLKHLHVQYIEGDWEVIVPRFISPCFLKRATESKPNHELNPWTASLICDLVNRICDSHHQDFYNWNTAAPTYLLNETVLNGWEVEDVECEQDMVSQSKGA